MLIQYISRIQICCLIRETEQLQLTYNTITEESIRWSISFRTVNVAAFYLVFSYTLHIQEELAIKLGHKVRREKIWR